MNRDTNSENQTIDPQLSAAIRGMWDTLTDGQKEQVKSCKSMDELALLAGREGVELPDEALDAVAGGCNGGGEQGGSEEVPPVPRTSTPHKVPASPSADSLSDNPFT